MAHSNSSFLNKMKYLYILPAYYHCISDILAEEIPTFAKVLKERLPRSLVLKVHTATQRISEANLFYNNLFHTHTPQENTGYC